MDVEILSRLQFAITIMFHYIYPPLSIGLGLLLVITEGLFIWTRKPVYWQMAKFWTTIFALTFAIGVATGIVMEFEFGTNWATYSRYVGDVFGSALAAEGVFAFFLESGFLALLLFGWNRVSLGVHYFATIMVALGAHFSAIWIIVANSWMQTPAGFKIEGEGLGARAVITDFWGMVFNPSSVDRLLHSIIGAWLAAAFLMISVSAYYLLRNKFEEFARYSLKIGLSVAVIALFLQVLSGDHSAKGVARNQPMKLAAMEGVFVTDRGVALDVAGWVDVQNRTKHTISIPYLLSFLTFGDFNAEIKGLDQIPEKDWPNVQAVFQSYHLMIAMWGAMFFSAMLAVYYAWRGTLYQKRGVLWLLVFSVFFPQIANQAGWITAEMGRYPWIVQDLLRISEGLSKAVTANQVLGSIIMFGIIYSLLFILFIYLLNDKIKKGPIGHEADKIYHQLKELAKEVNT